MGADLLKLNHRVCPSVLDSVQCVEALTSNVFGDRAQREVSMVKRGHKSSAPVLIKKRKRHQECMGTEKRLCKDRIRRRLSKTRKTGFTRNQP